MSPKAAFGSFVALLVLVLYVYLLWSAVAVAACVARSSPVQAPTPTPAAAAQSTGPSGGECTDDFTPDMASALSLISGLLAALVIAELAITKPGEAPAARALADDASPTAKSVLRLVTGIYMGVWAIGGLGALLIGWQHPDAVPTLTDLGRAWFGLAIAAGYSYFGISR